MSKILCRAAVFAKIQLEYDSALAPLYTALKLFCDYD